MGHFQIINGRSGGKNLGSFRPQSLEAFPKLNPQYFPPTLIRAEVSFIMLSMTTQRKEPIAGLFSLDDVSYVKQ